MRHPSALFLVLAVAAGCEQPTDRAVPPPEAPGPTPPSESAQVPESSIMRPEVAKEVEKSPPSAAPRELRAVISFERGAKLDDAARAALDTLVAQPAFAAGGAITLGGHSDTSGSDSENLITSRRRAEAVRDYLQSKGVDAERMSIIAFGERRPVAANAQPDGSDDPEGRQRNRRVEIVVAPASPADGTLSKDRSDTPAAPTE